MNEKLKSIRFSIFQPIMSIPHIIHCGEETRTNTDYALYGKYRQQDSSCVFQYTISGNGVFMNDKGTFPVPRGSGFFCRISDPKTGYFFPEKSKQPWHFIYFNFMGDSLASTVKELTSRHGPVFNIPQENPVIKRMAHLTNRNETSMSFYESAGIAANFLQLLLKITEQENSSMQPAHDLVQLAKNHIQQYLLHDINANEIARALNVSREHLSRIFTAGTGITLYQYILREKMLYACSLLKNTNMSTKEISSELGFSQPSHFCRTFQRIINMPPLEFRKLGTTPIFPA